MVKVLEEMTEEIAEHRNVTHEHSWIQNLTSHKKQITSRCLKSFSMSFRESHSPYDCALDFLLSYILSGTFNLFSLGNMKNMPYLFWRRRIICLKKDLSETPLVLLMNLRHLSLNKGFHEKKKPEMCSCFSYQYWSSLPFFLYYFFTIMTWPNPFIFSHKF